MSFQRQIALLEERLDKAEIGAGDAKRFQAEGESNRSNLGNLERKVDTLETQLDETQAELKKTIARYVSLYNVGIKLDSNGAYKVCARPN